MDSYDFVIVGSGPAGMGAAFALIDRHKDASILMIDKTPYSTGGMRNDCKMNFTFPIGFPLEYWEKDEAEAYLDEVIRFLRPDILPKSNIATYQARAERLGCSLLEIRQTHLGTDGGLELIKRLQKQLEAAKSEIAKREAQVQRMAVKYKEALSVVESLRSTAGQLQGEEKNKLLLTVGQYEKEMSKLRTEYAQLAAVAESGEKRRGMSGRSFERDRHAEEEVGQEGGAAQ